MVMLLSITQSYFYLFDISAQVSVVLPYDAAETKSFTLPDGVGSVTAEGWGGGGGGGYSSDKGQTTGGGGGGAYTKNTQSTPLTGGNRVLQLTVGAGGSGESGKSNGGTSIVDISGTRLLIAVGGDGVSDNITSGGTGGQATVCIPKEYAFSGGNGGHGNGKGGGNFSSGGGGGAAGTNENGGNGGNGSSSGGSGGTAGTDGGKGGTGSEGQASGSEVGNPGEPPGGGGGGGKRPFGIGGDKSGGNGSTGRIILSLTISPPIITGNGNCYSPNWNLVLTSSYTSTAAQGVSYQWEKDGIAVPGATSASLKIAGHGNYTLLVTYAFTNSVYGATANTLQVTSAAFQVYLMPQTGAMFRLPNHSL